MPFAAAGAIAGLATAGIGLGSAIDQASSASDAANSPYGAVSPEQRALYTKQASLIDQEIADAQLNDAYAKEIAQGMTNPDFAAQVALKEGNIRSNLINAENATITGNRRNLAAGGPGLFVNQDRRDEAVSQALNKGFEGANEQAQGDVLGRISTAGNKNLQSAGALGSAGNQAGGLANQAGANVNAANQAYNSSLSSASDFTRALGNSLSQLGGLYGDNGNVSASNGGGNVTDYQGNLVSQEE